MSEIYQPAEDSYFFEDFLKNYFKKFKNTSLKNFKFLDMGTGSGILAQTALDSGLKKENILTADINSKAVKLLKLKNFNSVKSNLFSKINNSNKFDIVVFNAPYLPREDKKIEGFSSERITTGGKNGDEISINFLFQARNYLKKNGKIFLLISSLTPLNNIKKFKPKIVTKKKIFFEELIILEFSNTF